MVLLLKPAWKPSINSTRMKVESRLDSPPSRVVRTVHVKSRSRSLKGCLRPSQK